MIFMNPLLTQHMVPPYGNTFKILSDKKHSFNTTLLRLAVKHDQWKRDIHKTKSCYY